MSRSGRVIVWLLAALCFLVAGFFFYLLLLSNGLV